jgi:hypothetical protein
MMVMFEDKFTPVKMGDYGLFAARRRGTESARLSVSPRTRNARGHREAASAWYRVEEPTESLTAEVESFVIDSVKKAGQPFQGHAAVTLSGH